MSFLKQPISAAARAGTAICDISSALVRTLTDAATAIVRGLGAALWQIAWTGDLAQRRIRRAEQREQALIDLNALVAVIYSRFLALYRQTEREQNWLAMPASASS
jgi:hypothetical protein